MSNQHIPTLGRRICEALGLKRCRNLSIHVPLNSAAYVIAELLLDTDHEKKAVAILQEYELTERKFVAEPMSEEDAKLLEHRAVERTEVEKAFKI